MEGVIERTMLLYVPFFAVLLFDLFVVVKVIIEYKKNKLN